MNPDSPRTPREELELRLTALLLGELSSDEAAAVRRALAQDAELAKLHDHLQTTIGLVRETVATQVEPAADQPPLKLSDERREKLLAHFKTVPLLPKLANAQRTRHAWMIPMSVAAALVALLGIAVLLPGLSRSKSRSESVYRKSYSPVHPWYSRFMPTLELGVAEGDSEAAYALKHPEAVAPVPSAVPQSEGAPATTARSGDLTYGLPMLTFSAGDVGDASHLQSANAVGYLDAGKTERLSRETQRLLSAETPPSTPSVTSSPGEPSVAAVVAPPAVGAFVAATPPSPPPTSAPRPSSSIVLPAVNELADSPKLAETKSASGDAEWKGVLEQPNQARSEDNRFLGRYVHDAKPTDGDALAATKSESWYFEKGIAAKSDFSGRADSQTTSLWDESAVTRGFYSDASAKDAFVVAQSADRPGRNESRDYIHDFTIRDTDTTKGRGTVTLADHSVASTLPRYDAVVERNTFGLKPISDISTASPASAPNPVTATISTNAVSAGGVFYGGYAMNPPPASVKLQGFTELNTERQALAQADADANGDKPPALGDTPSLGIQFYRFAGGAGGGGVQAQPPPASPSPAPRAGSSLAGAAITEANGVELVPFQPQLPAPALRGSPEDLPKGPNIEPLGTKPAGTVVLGQPEAAQAAADPELQAAFRRRYGIASAGEPLAGGVVKQSVSPATAPAVEGPTLNFGVATTKPLAPVEAKESETVAGRGVTPLASASRGGEPAHNAGDLVLSRRAAESDRKQVVELRDRYLANGRELTEGERIAPAEKVQSMDVDALTVTTTAGKDVAGVVTDGAARGQRPAIVLPITETGGNLGTAPDSSSASTQARSAGDRDLGETGAVTDAALKTKSLRVDPNAFRQGLESAGAIYSSRQEAESPAAQPWVRVNVAGGGRGGGGKPYPTPRTNYANSLEGAIQNYFTALGVDLNPGLGKSFSYDAGTGKLTVRGTQQELDVIQSATEVLAEAVVPQGAATDPKSTNVGREQSTDVRLSANVKQQEESARTHRPASSIVLPSSETGKDSPAAAAESEVLQKKPSAENQRSVSNPYSRTNLVRIGKGRQIITDKLTRIRLDDVQYSGLPLSEVLGQLHSESAKRDPDKKGVNFIFDPNSKPASGNVDPTTGLLNNDSTNMIVTFSPSLSDVSLQDALDAITRASDPPLKYSIEEYAVVFSLDTSKPRKSRAATPALIPQPEVQTSDNAFSTFSLNVSDVAFKLAAASLEKGQMPDAASVRAEEFINAFDYRDPEAPPGVPIAFAWERARYPFAHNRDLLRFSLKTAAAGRQAGRPLNLVLLLDNSGSMERADRVQIIREALRVLAGQLQPQDKLSVITFARTPRLWVDGVAGDKSGEVLDQVGGLTPQGGTNLEEAMNLAYATALRHYLAGGINRVVLLTDGAANLGNVEPEPLKQKVESHRTQGVAFDCFGIGWEGFNDDLLEVLSRNGDGRYGFINSPDEASTEFAGHLAGALKVAASDVKVQVEFNPKRVTAYRQIGYAKHQLTKEQFRDNTVDAAEIAAQEAGNALYTVEVNPAGEGPLCIVRCRFKLPGTTDYREHEWAVPYTGNTVSLEQASPAMRLAASASAFAEWLVVSPFAGEVTPDALLSYLSGVPEIYGADARPKKLEWMIRQAKSLAGK